MKADCFSILEEFGIGWPEPLNCAQFPDPPELCMKPTEDEITGGFSAPRLPTKGSSSSSSKPTGCPSDLVDVDPHDPKSHCAFACQSNVMFSTDNKVSSDAWCLPAYKAYCSKLARQIWCIEPFTEFARIKRQFLSIERVCIAFQFCRIKAPPISWFFPE